MQEAHVWSKRLDLAHDELDGEHHLQIAMIGALAEAKTDLKLHYEIRPNVPRAQLRSMKQGGLFLVQPGVESLSTHVLTLMKKHTTGARNLELLKWTTYPHVNGNRPFNIPCKH